MAEIARVKTVITGWAGGPGIMTHHFYKRTGLSWDTYAGEMVARCQALVEDVGNYLKDSITYTTEGTIDIIDESNGEIQQTLAGTNGSQTGLADALLLPTATGICVRWLTTGVVHGHHVQGRTFFVPLVGTGLQTDGTPDATLLGVFAAAAASFQGTGGEAVVPVIWSRPVTHATPTVPERPGTGYVITGAVVPDRYAVLRSRRT